MFGLSIRDLSHLSNHYAASGAGVNVPPWLGAKDGYLLTNRGVFVVRHVDMDVNAPTAAQFRNVYHYDFDGELVWQVGDYEIVYVESGGKKFPAGGSTFIQLWIEGSRLYAQNSSDFTFELDPDSGKVLFRRYYGG